MGKIVLIVEDDAFISVTIEKALQKEGFNVLSAKNVDEAQVFLRSNIPNIVLLDLILPQVSGIELLKWIKADPKTKSVPVIIFSNLASENDIQEAMNLGATAYFVKAMLSPAEVVTKVKEMLYPVR